MIRYDVVITKNPRPKWGEDHIVFLVSEKAMELCPLIFGNTSRESLKTGCPFFMTSQVAAEGFEKDCHENDLDVLWDPDMPYFPTKFRVETLWLSYKQDGLDREVDEYFSPLIDKAIEEGDKQGIGTLFMQFPPGVGKSFLTDRLRQTFPTIKDGSETLAAWANGRINGDKE